MRVSPARVTGLCTCPQGHTRVPPLLRALHSTCGSVLDACACVHHPVPQGRRPRPRRGNGGPACGSGPSLLIGVGEPHAESWPSSTSGKTEKTFRVTLVHRGGMGSRTQTLPVPPCVRPRVALGCLCSVPWCGWCCGLSFVPRREMSTPNPRSCERDLIWTPGVCGSNQVTRRPGWIGVGPQSRESVLNRDRKGHTDTERSHVRM